MYQALLDKARSQFVQSTASSASRTTPSTEQKTQTKTSQKTETKTAKKKKKKATPQSARTTHGTESSSVPVSSTTEASPAIQSTTPVTESTTQLTKEESSVPPQTEPKSQSKEPPKQQSDAETRIFQAKGTVIATPYVKGDCPSGSGRANRLKVVIEDCEYDLSYNRGYQRRAYVSLSSELKENGSKPMFLRLYPQATFDQSSAEPILSFSLVNYSQDCEKINDEPKGFVLRGIWQYIPESKSPVITIYRNREQLGYFKRLNKSRQFNFAKPHHIPVVWDAPVEPFKYNPQAEKDSRTSHEGEADSPSVSSQMPRYFVEVRAIFKDGLYVVEEMLREPTLKIPRFIKVSKSSATT